MEYSMLDTRRFSGLFAGLALAAAVMLAPGEIRAQNCNDFATGDFTKTSIASGLSSPMKMKITADGRIFFIQRNGFVQLLKPGASTPTQALELTVPGGSNNEDGLLGIALDPKFASNNWIYLFYTPTTPMGYRVSRFTLTGDVLDKSSEKILLTVPHVFSSYGALIIHGAGAMDFDPAGNLLIATGDLSITISNHPVPVNENSTNFDAQKTSANTNHLLGKIIRITPKDDGTYTVPAGNLFPPGTAQTKPEIYAMGMRNPFTMTVDPKTGWIYSGEVGPDGTGGPIASQDEINQVKAPGNFGWPYLTGNNQAYSDMAGAKYNPTALVNPSKNNTGLRNIPNGVSALFYMANGSSWPISGITPNGGNRCIKIGAFYRYNPQGTNSKRLPPYFDNGFFMANHNNGETMRYFKLNEEGSIAAVRTFLTGLARPMSFEIGPDGALYVMEWGTDRGHWFNGTSASNPDGRISRIVYNGACSTTGVSTRKMDAEMGRMKMSNMIPGARIRFPEGAKRVSAYGLDGKRIFTLSKLDTQEDIETPQNVRIGLAYLVFAET